MEANFIHRGLSVSIQYDPIVPATHLDPAQGGEVTMLEWEVEDIEEVTSQLNVNSEVADLIEEFFTEYGVLPIWAKSRIEDTWGLDEVATEHCQG